MLDFEMTYHAHISWHASRMAWNDVFWAFTAACRPWLYLFTIGKLPIGMLYEAKYHRSSWAGRFTTRCHHRAKWYSATMKFSVESAMQENLWADLIDSTRWPTAAHLGGILKFLAGRLEAIYNNSLPRQYMRHIVDISDDERHIGHSHFILIYPGWRSSFIEAHIIDVRTHYERGNILGRCLWLLYIMNAR